MVKTVTKVCPESRGREWKKDRIPEEHIRWELLLRLSLENTIFTETVEGFRLADGGDLDKGGGLQGVRKGVNIIKR